MIGVSHSFYPPHVVRQIFILFDQVNFVLELIATAAFAVTGVLAITQRRVDFFSAVVLGVITAIGGGTVRDLILDVPIFWAADVSYVRYAVIASVLTFLAQSLFSRPQIYAAFLYIEALGAALFGVGGTLKAIELDFGWPFGPIILGIITAFGGGLLRDLLAGRTTLLMSNEIYTIPMFIGCLLLVLGMQLFPDFPTTALISATLVAFLIRAAAIRWSWQLPGWFTTKP